MARSDESALIALTLEYADAVRARDAQRWAATWTDDARWVLDEGREVVGRDGDRRDVVAAIAKYSLVVQLYLACTYDIDGDDASGRCEFQELNWWPTVPAASSPATTTTPTGARSTAGGSPAVT